MGDGGCMLTADGTYCADCGSPRRLGERCYHCEHLARPRGPSPEALEWAARKLGLICAACGDIPEICGCAPHLPPSPKYGRRCATLTRDRFARRAKEARMYRKLPFQDEFEFYTSDSGHIVIRQKSQLAADEDETVSLAPEQAKQLLEILPALIEHAEETYESLISEESANCPPDHG